MALRIQTGMRLLGNVKSVEGNNIDYVDEDGQVAFSVTIGKDGRSLEIYSAGDYQIEGTHYGCQLQVEPRSANRITVRTTPNSI